MDKQAMEAEFTVTIRDGNMKRIPKGKTFHNVYEHDSKSPFG